MVIRENDIIISKTRPSRGAISLIDKCFDGFITSSGFAVIRKVKDEMNLASRSDVISIYALRFDSTLKEQRCSGCTYPVIIQETQIQIAVLRDRAYTLKKKWHREAMGSGKSCENAKQEVENIIYLE